MGMGPLGQGHEEPGNACAQSGRFDQQNAIRQAPSVLLRSLLLHRSRTLQERQADTAQLTLSLPLARHIHRFVLNQTKTPGVHPHLSPRSPILRALRYMQRVAFIFLQASAWSHLPGRSTCRNGIEFSTLSDDQQTAAKTVLQSALNTSPGVGYDQAM